MFYGRIINSTISNAITNVGSAAGQLALQLQNTSAGAPTFPNILASASATPVRPDVVVFEDNAQNPLVHEYDLILEHRIAANTLVSVSYVGSAGRNLPLFIDANLPAPSGTVTYQTIGGPLDGQAQTMPLFTGARPNLNFSRITHHLRAGRSRSTTAWSWQVNRRLSGGLQLQASYTEARATDNGQSSQTFTNANNVLNPLDLGLEEGTSNFEIRHRFVANAIWNPNAWARKARMTHTLFSGFTIAPTFVMTSGVPYTALLTGNTPNTARVSTGVLGAGGTNRLPSIERNSFHLPTTANVDLRVSRGFSAGRHAQARSDSRRLQRLQPPESHAGEHDDLRHRRNGRGADADVQPDLRLVDEREQQLLRVHAAPGAARAPVFVLDGEYDVGTQSSQSTLRDPGILCGLCGLCVPRDLFTRSEALQLVGSMAVRRCLTAFFQGRHGRALQYPASFISRSQQ